MISINLKSGSAILIFIFRKFFNIFPVSRLISLSLDIPPEITNIFSNYSKILISFPKLIPVFQNFFSNKINKFFHIFK